LRNCPYNILWNGADGRNEVLEERLVPIPPDPPDIPKTGLGISLALGIELMMKVIRSLFWLTLDLFCAAGDAGLYSGWNQQCHQTSS